MRRQGQQFCCVVHRGWRRLSSNGFSSSVFSADAWIGTVDDLLREIDAGVSGLALVEDDRASLAQPVADTSASAESRIRRAAIVHRHYPCPKGRLFRPLRKASPAAPVASSAPATSRETPHIPG